MSKKLQATDKAVNGCSYSVKDSVLTDVTVLHARKTVGDVLVEFIGDRFYADDWLKNPGSLIKRIGKLLIELHQGKYPKEVSDAVIVKIPELNECSKLLIISSKDNRLSCPYCDRPELKKLNRGRECFHKGGRHNLKLAFFSSKVLENEDSIKDYLIAVDMLWQHYYESLPLKNLTHDKKINCLIEIPLNIVHKDRLDVYMLSPRTCVKNNIYLWQYRLMDKFVHEESLTRYCPLCCAKNLEIIREKQGFDFRSPVSMPVSENIRKHSGITKSPVPGVKLAQCKTCFEYSFVLNKSLFNEFVLYFKDMGLCSNCCSTVPLKNKNGKILKCEECGHTTPLYKRQGDRQTIH